MDDADDLRLVALSGVDERLLLLDLGSVCNGKEEGNLIKRCKFKVLYCVANWDVAQEKEGN